MTPYPKRLIEVDLPIARISTHARREKSIRHGHISTLHIWWARRPLAACRAVILASLWPDPVDLAEWAKEADAKGEIRAAKGERLKPGEGVVIRPKRFLDEARQRMNKWAQIGLHKASPESYKLMVQVQKNPKLLDDPAKLRTSLLDFIADFANWDNSTDKDYLDTSRALVQAAHESLGGEAGTRPMVIDPFAGGGSIPLEALRVGADAFASDLNPIPVLLNKAVLELLPAQGSELSRLVKVATEKLAFQASEMLASLYPVNDPNEEILAYIWAHTVVSEAAGQDGPPVEIPLISSMWLSKKPHRGRALRWRRDKAGAVETETMTVAYCDGSSKSVRRPVLEVFEPAKASEVSIGTVARGSATCPVTGFTMPVARVRVQLTPRRGGTSDARLLCVVTTHRNERGRFYRVPTTSDMAAITESRRLAASLAGSVRAGLSAIPDEPTPDRDGHRAVSSLAIYGIKTFGDLFTPRQQVLLVTLCDLVPKISRDAGGGDADRVLAIQTFLSLAVGKVADYCSALATWSSPASQETVRNTFGRQALAMVWDFAEASPFASSSGGLRHMAEFACKAIEAVAASSDHPGTAMRADATTLPLPDDCAAAMVTDPPYYDSIPYADLADFFYVWIKRAMRGSDRGLFDEVVTPKEQQAIVWHPSSVDERRSYERKMALAMGQGRRVVVPQGIGVVVFAHKSTTGWEAQLQSMIDAGWTITASWPIDTERAGRTNANNTASLASSIHLVCRPSVAFEHPEAAAGHGEWREVLGALPGKLSEWMPRLADEGVVGADAIFACLGPALEIFSRYSRVEKASGEAVTLREYLEHVWAAVSNEALSMIFKDADAAGLEPDARLTAMWLWTIGGGNSQPNGDIESEEEDEGGEVEEEATGKKSKVTGFILEFDAARKIAQGLGIHLEKSESIVEVKGESARLLPVSERTRYLFGKDAEDDTAKSRKAKKKVKQGSLFEELDAIEAEATSAGGRFGGLEGAKPGATVLDKVHQSMILFAAGRGEALKRFLVEDGVGKDGRFWKLAQSLSALYPTGTDEKRWVDGVLARKKGLGY